MSASQLAPSISSFTDSASCISSSLISTRRCFCGIPTIDGFRLSTPGAAAGAAPGAAAFAPRSIEPRRMRFAITIIRCAFAHRERASSRLCACFALSSTNWLSMYAFISLSFFVTVSSFRSFPAIVVSLLRASASPTSGALCSARPPCPAPPRAT